MKRHDLDVDDLVRRYLAGESEKAIADSVVVSRNVIRRRLLERGVPIRGRSEAERVKWSRMTLEQRAAQVAPAHAGRRGQRVSTLERERYALTRQRCQIGVSPTEDKLRVMLAKRGIETIPQQAVGPYNCDLGAFPVAVEVFGGNWHWSGRHAARTPKRLRYFLDHGWHALMLQVTAAHPLTEAAVDYVASYVQQARGNPSAGREYRVVRSAGELIASGSADDDELSIEPAFTHGRDRLGRYATVPRQTVGV